MYLRDVMVIPAESDKAVTRQLRLSSDHTLDIVRHYLPPKFDLHGLRRVVINLGCNPQDDRKYYDGGGSVGYYSIPDFCLSSYFNLPSREQEEAILCCVERTFVDLADRFAKPLEPLLSTIARVRSSGFRLDLELKCSKFHPSRKLRVAIVETFAPGGVFVRAEIRSRLGETLQATELISGAWVVTARHRFHSSRWRGNALEILDGSGVLTAHVPCDDFLAP